MKMSRKEYYELPIVITDQYGMRTLSLSSFSPNENPVPLKRVAKVTSMSASKIDAIYFDINGINVALCE